MRFCLELLIIAAYGLCIYYDWCCVKRPKDTSKDRLFYFGVGLLALATVLYLMISVRYVYGFVSVFFLIIAAAALLGEIIALFFTLPRGTYTKPGMRRKAYKHKMYALCRHPGVLFHTVFYIFLWLAMPSAVGMIDIAFLIAGNLIYMLIQDIWSFPQIFIDYDRYKKRVPMFIPNKKSIQRCFSDYRR